MSTWTTDKINLMMTLAKEGFSAAQIAERVCATRNAVLGKVHRLGCKLVDLNGDKRTARRYPHKRQPPTPRRVPVAEMAPPLEAPAAAIPAQATKRYTLMDLQPDSCKWPTNDGGPFLFCGAPRRDDGPYCEHHAHKAYGPTKRQ